MLGTEDRLRNTVDEFLGGGDSASIAAVDHQQQALQSTAVVRLCFTFLPLGRGESQELGEQQQMLALLLLGCLVGLGDRQLLRGCPPFPRRRRDAAACWRRHAARCAL